MRNLLRSVALIFSLLILSFLAWRNAELLGISVLPYQTTQSRVSIPSHEKPSDAKVTDTSAPTQEPTAPHQGTSSAGNASTSLSAGDPPPLPPATLRQIAAILEAKERRTPTERKIDSQLLVANDQRKGVSAPGAAPLVAPSFDHDSAGRILTDIKADVTERLLSSITEHGGVVVNHFAQHRAIRAWLPLDEITGIANLSEVAFIMPAVRAVTNKANTSEGDVTHKAVNARATYSVSGAGIKVGVLSDSVDYLSTVKASGDLPATVTVLPGQAGNENGAKSGEGTAMLEIVYDLAPSASLYFATAFTGPAAFAENIRALHAAGCRVIIDDVGYFNQSPFQDDVIAKAVNEVTAAGTLYFSSAGNSGNKNDGTSACWEGDFVQGSTMTVGGASRPIQRFGALAYNVLSGGDDRADLFWADPLGASGNDYDLFILNSSGSVISQSTNSQSGSQDPYEWVGSVATGSRIVVVKYSGADRFLHLEVGRSELSVSTDGITRGQSCAVNAFCVAAVNVATSYPSAFEGGSKNPVEDFSSDGRRRMFFNADGTPYTPGNFSSTGGVVRNKPDLAAADGVQCATSGFNPFYGTSAAAPHAGAIAALLRSYNSSLTTDQYRSILTASTLDIEALGSDRDSGAGIVMADKVLAAAPAPQSPTITSFNPTSGTVGQSVLITGTKFTGTTNVSFNNVAATAFSVNSSTQITVMVPAGASTGVLKVTTPSGTATSSGSFTVTPSPVISSITPASGAVGTSVVISGSFFTGASVVKFNGVNSTFTVNSASQITATVPTGATTGRVTVTVGATTATSPTNFTLITSPIISSLTPSAAGIGSLVVLSGANFSGTTSVKFNNISASFTVNSANQITATVPSGATTGAVSITNAFGTGTGPSFTVVPTPTITSSSPASAAVGSTVIITGVNLTGATSVTFGGIASLNFTVLSDTQISAVVPTAAATGVIRVITLGGTATSTASFTIIGPPSNNNFASAQLISGTSGSVSGSNAGATREIGEPIHAGNVGGRSIWFRWIAPSNMTVRFTTLGSAFDTLLAVYTGNSVSSLSPVAASDDADGLTTSSVAWVAISGTTYYIAIDGRSAGVGSETANGAATVAWSATTSQPALTSFSPLAGVVGSTVTLTGANFTGVTAVQFNGINATFSVANATTINATVPSAATNGPITIRSAGGVAVSAAAFTINAVLNNDMFVNAQVITTGTGSISSYNTGATKEVGEPSHAGNAGGKSVWFKWTAPASGVVEFHTDNNSFDTLLAVYTGSAVGSLSVIASNDDALANNASQVSFTASVGVVYRIAVDGYSGAVGTFNLLWSTGSPPPTITNFVPSSDGTSVVITGSNFLGTTAVLFGGVSATSFTVNSATQITAVVPAGAVSGVISVVAPGGTVASADVFTVKSPPANDSFANRFTLTGNSALIWSNNAFASIESGEPSHASIFSQKSVWFRWTAPTTGSWTISTVGSLFDTLLAVYTGSSLTSLTAVASDDDGGVGNTSAVTLNATAGVTYSIALAGFAGASGDYFLKVMPVINPLAIYQSGFEAFEGYTTGVLSGQMSWTSAGSGGNGIVSGLFTTGGNQAYIGYSPPTDSSSYLFSWRPINLTPDLVNRPVVRFSVDMSINDSTNSNYDTFSWWAFNRSGASLFSIDFDNLNLKIGYTDSAGNIVDTGFTFSNGTKYNLIVDMDYANNRWSAWLNGTAIATNVTLATAGVVRDLGDIDAYWDITGTTAGNNYLVFDNYSIISRSSGQPIVYALSGNQTRNAGGSVTLAVGANGIEPMTYQWQFNGSNILGAIYQKLDLTSLQEGQTGNYSVIITNAYGSVTSGNVQLTVQPAPSAPEFTLQPVSQSVTVGNTVTFNVEASGYPTPTYQWYLGSSPLIGKTSATLSITNVQLTDTGTYSVKAFNASAPTGVASSSVILTVNSPSSGIQVFRAAQGLSSNGSQDSLTPAGDSVPNLLKYAFNMIGSGPGQVLALTTPNSSVLTPSGSAGLPLVGVENGTGRLQITYIRPKATATSGVTCTVMFSDSLINGSWSANPNATESVTSIDSTYERVIVTDSATVSNRRFVRVQVSVP